jgi:hypothetical protein
MWTYCSDINAIFYRISPTFSDIYQNLLSELRAELRAAPTFLYQSMSGASRRPYFSTFYPEKLPQDPIKGSASRSSYPHSLSREIASR